MFKHFTNKVETGLNLVNCLLRRAKQQTQYRFDQLIHGSDFKKKHIVVCGSPRSGTSLLYNMLNTSLPDLHFDEWEISSTVTLKHYANHVSKSPLDILHVEDILHANQFQKQIYWLVLIRDIRDTITSVHPNKPDDYFIGYAASYNIFGTYPNYRTELNAPGLKDIFEAIDQLTQSGQSYLLLKYEDLIENTDEIQVQIADLFDLSFSNKFSDYHRFPDKHGMKFAKQWQALNPELVKSSQAVTTNYVQRWRKPEHHARIIEEFTKYPALFDLLCQHGYESDDNWFNEIRTL